MSESKFTVTALLSAKDNGFTKTMNNASKTTSQLSQKWSNFKAGIFQGMGQAVFHSFTNGVRGLVSEIDASNAAWKTFDGNMKILGKSDKAINAARKSMQNYAETTIYSSSDMANTYAQLAAVGVKNTDKLVMAFGGLAGASENPAQAMKTLSQQATQMAAKPEVAWQDFKLMLEQTPAGIAAVAKEMGMSTSEMVTAVQDGEISTKKFFKAVEAVGNSKGFQNQAQQYKTVGQAMDGLQETLGNKLLPAFNVLSQKGISAISGIIDKVSQIDGDAIAKKVTALLEKAQPYIDLLIEGFKIAWKYIKIAGQFLLDHSDTIAKALPYVLGLVGAYKAFKVVNTVAPGMMKFAGSITQLASKGISAIAGKLFGIAAAETATGTASEVSSKSVLEMALAFLALGGGVALVAAGFALFAFSAIQLANAGGLAIGVMVGMVATMAALAYGASLIAPALTAGAVGFVAFGGAIALAGAGALLASVGLSLIAGKLPMIAAYGLQGALAITALGGSLIVFSVGAAVASVALLGLSASLVAIAAVIAVVGASFIVAGVGATAFGVGLLLGAAGALVMSAGLKAVASRLKTIVSSAKNAEKSLKTMQKSVKVVENGLSALGGKAKTALSKLTSAFNNSASKAKSAGQKVGKGFTSGLQSGLNKAPSIASRAIAQTISKLRSGQTGAYSSGAFIGKGLANGMSSCLGRVRSIASKLVAQANKAIEAKAKIGSPSKITTQYGKWYGEGYVNGINGMIKKAHSTAESLVTIPQVQTPSLSMAYSGGMSSDYSYSSNSSYIIEVPVNVDGKEVARVTAPYTQAELNKREKRENRKKGKV